MVEFLLLVQLVDVGHEDLEAGLRGHSAVAVGELTLIVDEVEVEPGVVGGVDEGEVGGVHGESAEAEGATLEAQEVVPLGELGLIVGGVAVDQDEVGAGDRDIGELAFDVGRRQEFEGIEEDVVFGDLNAAHGGGAHEVVDLDVKALHEAFDGELEDADFFDVEMDAAIGGGRDGGEQVDGQGDVELVDGAGEVELVALAADENVFQGEAGGVGVEEVADVAEVGVDDALLDEQEEGVGIVEGGVGFAFGAQELAGDPGDVDAELRAFAEKQVVGVDSGGEIGSVGRFDRGGG